MTQAIVNTPPVKVKKKKHFVNNKDLLAEVIASKLNLKTHPERGYGPAMTRTLVNMLMVMVDRFAEKNNWSQYSYIDELKGQALLNLCDKWYMFDPDRNPIQPNPFAFYTAVIQNSFRGQVQKEKKPQKIRDAILKSRGLTPSFGQQLDDEGGGGYTQEADYAIGVESEAVPTDEQTDNEV